MKKILIFCFVAMAAFTTVNALTKKPINDTRVGLWPDDPPPTPEPPSEPKPKVI